MSRSELDGWLSAYQKLTGKKRGNNKSSSQDTQSFKSLRKKRKKGKSRNGR